MAACLIAAFVAQIMAENSTIGYQSTSNTTQTKRTQPTKCVNYVVKVVTTLICVGS